MNSALAYSPDSESLEIAKALDSLEQEMDNVNPESIIPSEGMISNKKFNRIKKRALKKLSKEYKKIIKLSQEEREEYVVKQFIKKSTKAKKLVDKISKRPRLLNKIAERNSMSVEEMKANLLEAASDEFLEQALMGHKEKIAQAGGYDRFLQDQLNKVQSLSYNEVVNSQEMKSSTSDISEILLITLHYSCTIGSLIAVVLGVIMLVVGGPALAFILIGTLSFAGYMGFLMWAFRDGL